VRTAPPPGGWLLSDIGAQAVLEEVDAPSPDPEKSEPGIRISVIQTGAKPLKNKAI
jgi:hypothetical protein